MPERRRKYTAEFKNEAAKMVVETSRPIAEVAREWELSRAFEYLNRQSAA